MVAATKLKRVALVISILLFTGVCSPCVFAQENLPVISRRSQGAIQFLQYANGGWELRVDDAPFFIKSAVYSFNAGNRSAEKVRDDFAVMKEIGVNTVVVRFNNHLPYDLLSQLYEEFHLKVIFIHFLSGPTRSATHSWSAAVNYADPQLRKALLADVQKMVLAYKDAPYLLSWMFANENEVVQAMQQEETNGRSIPFFSVDFAQLVNRVVILIHALDSMHPVGVANVSTGMFSLYKKYAAQLDYVGLLKPLGYQGFGNIFSTIKFYLNRPVFISEYAIGTAASGERNRYVAYHAQSFKEIKEHTVSDGQNCIGGVVYSWLDTLPGKKAPRQETAPLKKIPHDIQPHVESAVPTKRKEEKIPFISSPNTVYYVDTQLQESIVQQK